MKYFKFSVAFQYILGTYPIVTYSLATPTTKDQADQTLRRRVQIDLEPRGNLTERAIPIMRAMTDCPGTLQDRSKTNFFNSKCGLDRDPRSYNVACSNLQHGVRGRPEGFTIEWDDYQGRCGDDELCMQHGIRGNSIAYCVNVVNLGQTYLLTRAGPANGISGAEPPEQTMVPTIDTTGEDGVVYAPSSPKAHRFSVALTGHDTQDTMYWAQQMSIQPMKAGKPLGSPTTCGDCVRNEVQGWPVDTDGFDVDLTLKDPGDSVTINWDRLFLPYV
ncbi:MAG: hypothetical protein Q9160_009078 [Pyrenula sp. 1 TL-2023]